MATQTKDSKANNESGNEGGTESGALHFELVSPERVEASQAVKSVLLPGSEGHFAVMKNHAPLVAALRPGVIEITDENPSAPLQRFFVDGGFVEVNEQGCIVLAQNCSLVESLDRDAIQKKLDELKAKDQSVLSTELPTSGSWPERLVVEAKLAAITN